LAIRLKDIARELNLSVITVSKALRSNSDISDATRQRILARMKELDYQPNMAARALATGLSSTLGLIVPDLVHPFFAELAKAMGSVLHQHDNGLILASSGEDAEIEQAEIKMMLARGVDALLIASCQSALEGFYSVHNQRTPFVLVDRCFPQLRANFVGTDDFAGGVMATEHLLQRGCRHLAHIGGPDLSPAADRLHGFRTALMDHGLRPAEELILSRTRVEESGDEAGYAMMQELLKNHPRPDGVFCYNDITAIGAMQAAIDAGFSVPEDIAFVGFGNVRYSKYLRIPLTSVEQSTTELGEAAAQLALDLVAKKLDKPMTIRLRPTLAVRASSAGQSVAFAS
jgi:LacI family transcriptional regulator